MIRKNRLSGRAGWDNTADYLNVGLILESYCYDASITGVV